MIRYSFRKWMLPFYSNVRFLKKVKYIPMNCGVDHDLLSVDPKHLIFPVNTNNLEQNGKYSNPHY